MYFPNPFSGKSHATYRFWHRLDSRLGMSLRLVIVALACLVVVAPAVAEDESSPPANEPPVVTAPANRTYEQGEAITAFGITVTDAENDTVTVTVTGLPKGLSYTSHQVQGTVAPDAAAQHYTVTIAADDGVNTAVTATFDIVVTAVDSVPPTVSIKGPRGRQPAAFWLTIVFSEPVTGFEQSDVTVGNGTVLKFSPESAGYRVKIRAASSGTVTVDVNADVADDEAGNGNRAANRFSVESDRDRPQLAITGPAAVQTGPFDVALTFSEPVTGFEQSEVSVSNGTLTAFSGTDATYAATIMPAASGTVTIDVAAGVARDAAGNPNYPAGHAQQATLNSPPVPTVPADKTYGQGDTITAFGITASDADGDTVTVTVTGLPSGLSYTSGQVQGKVAAEATAQDYVVTISADDGVNAAVTATFTITVSEAQASNTPPVIAPPNNKTYEQGEAITAFGITVSDADGDPVSVTLTGLPSGLSYTSDQVQGTVAPDAAAQHYTVTIVADDGVNTAVAATFDIVVTAVDSVPPTVSIKGPRGRQPAAFWLTIVFSELVTGFEESDVTVGNGTVLKFSPESAGYRVKIRAASSGTVTVDVNADVADDEAGNGNRAANRFSVESDRDRPQLAITGPAAVQTGPFDVALTFSEPVTGFEQSEVSVSNGTLTAFSGTDATYAATIMPAASGTVTIDVAAGVARDAAGNPNYPAGHAQQATLNSPPVPTVPADKTYEQGDTITAFGITASDADGDTVMVTVTGLPSGLSYTSGQVQGTVAAEATAQDYVVTISADDGVNAAVTATFTITVGARTSRNTENRDSTPQVTIADASADEGDAMAFTVTLDKAVSGGLTVTPSFTDGTAIEGTDYTENTADIIFSGKAGETQTFTVATTENAVVEGDKSFTVSLTVSGTTEPVTASDTATGVIVNDDSADAPPVFINSHADNPTTQRSFNVDIIFSKPVTGFEKEDVTVGNGRVNLFQATGDAEYEAGYYLSIIPTAARGTLTVDVAEGVAVDVDGNGNRAATRYSVELDVLVAALTIADASATEGDQMTFTVTLDNEMQEALTVTPSFTDGTAIEGTDYTENTSDISFSGLPGETRSFTVSTTHDDDAEQDETFAVSLSVSDTLMPLTATDTATGTIIDDDAAVVTIADAAAAEGEAMTFTVTLDRAVPGGLSVTPSFTDNTAASGVDYTENAAGISFTGNADEARTFTVSTDDDGAAEHDETFTVSLAVSGTSERVRVSGTATGTIIDDDAAVVTIADATAAEGDAMTFTVTLDRAVQGGLTVTPSFTDNTAASGADYTENTDDITFTGNANEARTFTVSTREDADPEQDETFGVRLSMSDAPPGVTASGTATGTIIDDDAPMVTIADASADEGEVMTFTVSLDKAVSGGLTVTPSFTDNTAASDADYRGNAAGIGFTGNANETRTFTVATAENEVVEGDKSFTVSLTVSGTTEPVTASDTATGTIIDDDAAVVTIADATAAEGDAMTFTVTVDKAVQGGLTVTPSFRDGTATEGTDYTENTADIIFSGNAGETWSFTVSTTEDADAEQDETFAVRLNVSEAPPGVTATDTATGTITDDDSAMLTIANAAAAEGDAMTFTVTLDKAVQGGLTVTPSLTDGTAIESTDYTENKAGISLTGNANETRTFTVATTEDDAAEHDETFTVSLAVSGTQAPVWATGTATGTIIDDDPAVVTIADATAAEGDAMTFRVTLDKAVQGGLTVTPSFRDGTATEGTDYTENTADIIFSGNAGETWSFTVSTTEDTAAEQDETFAVRLSVSEAPPGVTATDTATGTITDDDSAMLTITDAAAAEGDEITFTVTLNAAVPGGLTVTPNFTDDTAASGTDYTENTTGIHFTGNAGETKTFTVSTTEGAAAEQDETFMVSLIVSGTSETVRASDTATGTIIDNDSTPQVTIADASAAEGDEITFTVTLDAAVPGGLTVTPNFTDGTAVEGTDYNENLGGIRFTGIAGETKSFTVSTTEGGDPEYDETFTVSLAVSGTSETVQASDTATGTIIDDDAAVVTISDASALEGDVMTFTLTLDKAVPGGLTVTPSFTDGTASGGQGEGREDNDYIDNLPPVHFTGNAGEQHTVTFVTTEDTVVEGNESFFVQLAIQESPGESVVKLGGPATGTIIDDDGSAAVTVADASADEGDKITFTVILDKAVQGGLAVKPSFTDVTATKRIDYTENLSPLTFTGTAKETQIFTVPTSEDQAVEADETFTVSLAVSGAQATVTATDTATGTIIDDDGSAAVTVADASAGEGDAISFTVTLNRAVQGGLTVTPSFTDVTAAKGTDYAENTTELNFVGKAKETQTFTVATTEDTAVEADETFTVSLAVSGAQATVTATDTATGTITDDDSAAVSIADASANEGDTMSFTVTLNQAVQGGLTVTPSFTDVTATKGTDYTENDAPLTFTGTANETQTFTVATAEDEAVEADETLTVSLAVSGAQATVTATDTATGTITDDDGGAAVTVADASANEGDAISFTVTLNQAVSGGLTVTPAFTDATATKGADYTENIAPLTFTGTANESQTFTVATTEDAAVEANETFTVSLAVSGTQATVTATDTATGTITNDDGSAAVTIVDASAHEGDAISFTVTLNQAVQGGLTVTPSFTDVTATRGTDYAENPAGINFAGTANETRTFTVSTTEDAVVETDETFTVTLVVSGTQATVTATDTATGTITDDDSAAVSIADASASEGETLRFTVTLDGAVQGGLKVTPAFTDATAARGMDYTESTAALSFVGNANETQTFTVATTEDTAEEADETFAVTLVVSGTQATVTATDTATGTITDDDGGAAVTIADASANEGDAISFTVTLNQAVSGGLTVTPAFTDATAAKGADYTENTAALNFVGNANETRTFTVSTTKDAVVETDETFTVSLAVSGTQATVMASDTATGTITNDDGNAAVTIADASANEGDAISFTVTLDKAVQGGLKVTPVFTDVTAAKGTDYTESTAALNFVGSANESQTFTVATTEDAAVETDETFTVSLAVSGTQAMVAATDTATGIILGDDIVGDDDRDGPPGFDEGDPNAPGGGQTSRAVSENAPPGSPVGDPVTATDPNNALLTYALSGSNAFVIDSGTGQIRVAAGAELDYEGDTNTYIATVQAGNDKGDTAIITVTINVMNVNEPPVAIGRMPRQVLLVGASATIDSGPYFLDPDGDPLHYDAKAIDPDIATAVTSSPPVITTAKAEGATTVVVTTCDPSKECATQSFPVLAIEASISFVPDRLRVTEGDAKPYTVKLQTEPAGPVKVMLTSDNPGAATVSPTELTFTPEAWDTHQRVNVTGVQDADADDERVVVTHQTSGGGYHMTADFIVTVADDDTPGVTITPTEVAVDEGATVTAAYTVVLDTRPRGDVTVEPASDDSDVATVSPHVLTFTQETWDKPRAVSVTGVTDQDAADATVAVRHKVTGADYTGVAAGHVHVWVVDKAESVRVSMASAWLARFGRTVTSQAMDMIGERVRGTSLAGLTLAGRQVSLDTSPLPPLQNRNGDMIVRDLETRDLLLQSSFQLALDESHGSAGNAWSVWGRAGTDGFKGKPGGRLLDGTVLSGYLGIDYRFDTGALAGVAISHSRGTGRFDGPEVGTGEAEAALTSVPPYARWSPRRGIEVWGLVGLGKGDFAMRDAFGRLGTDISLQMAALGMRGALPSVSVLDLALEVDGAVTRVASQPVPGLPRLHAGVQRLRLALEGSLDYVPAKGALLTPAFEIGLRHDGGDADTGLGVEIGASLNYVNLMSGLTVALRGRTLVAHQDSRYEEWGVSGVIGLDPGVKGQGLALALVPSYGPAASGMQQLLNRHVSPPAENNNPGMRLEAEISYGIGIFGGRGLITPYGGLGIAGGRSETLAGGRLAMNW